MTSAPAGPAPLHLAVALDGAGWHPAAWREADAQPQRLFTAGYWTGLAQQAERGLGRRRRAPAAPGRAGRAEYRSDARVFTGTAAGLADLLQDWQAAGCPASGCARPPCRMT